MVHHADIEWGRTFIIKPVLELRITNVLAIFENDQRKLVDAKLLKVIRDISKRYTYSYSYS